MVDDNDKLIERTDTLLGETKELIARLLAKSDRLLAETMEISGKMALLATQRVDERTAARST
jgi:hypothetical protein